MNKSLITNLISISLIAIGYLSPYYSYEIKTMGLYSFSGAVTNWLAIHMLFEKVPFLYGSGILTERFEEFKTGIRNLIMNQFFTQENFEKFMSNNKSEIIKIEEDSIIKLINFDNVFVKLKSAIVESPFGGMLNMFGGEQALEPLRPQFEEQFKEIIKEVINDENFLANIINTSENDTSFSDSVVSIVDQRLNELTPQMVKGIIQDMIKKHLGWLVVWGGVFGALIGVLSTFL